MTYPKVPQVISDPVNENIEKLADLFPSVVKDGELDVEALKQELGNFNEAGQEKYELNWAGKQESKEKAYDPIVGKTLKHIIEDSKNPEMTNNLFIEGDNLEVLKLLRQNYYRSIKLIYIDPPYNTGNDFIYNDNFSMSKKESDIVDGNVSDLGERYTLNRREQNRYHANWLNMMHARLLLSRDLLKDDGVIFISIDDGEVNNIRRICNEVFGEDNFIASLIWKSRQNKDNRSKNGVSVDHEYVITYGKKLRGVDRNLSGYSNSDNDDRGDWTSANMVGLATADRRPNLHYDLIDPETDINYGCPHMGWRYDKNTMAKLISENRILWPSREDGRPRRKSFVSELSSNQTNYSSIIGKDIYTRNGTADIIELFNSRIIDFPKPKALLKELILQANIDHNEIILDFFSGSATTAHAVMELNLEDSGLRNFIMVQLPEICDEKSEAFKAGYKNICEIGKERIRRAGERILDDNKEEEGIKDLDIGFKVFRIGDTNINWLHEDLRGGDLFDHYDKNASDKDRLDFTPGFKDIDVVYEIMLRQTDIPLSSKVEQLTDIGGRTYIFADSFLVSLEQTITQELVDRLAALEPLPIKFIFRDSAFDDDIALKDETFRRLNALIDRNNTGEEQTYTVEFI